MKHEPSPDLEIAGASWRAGEQLESSRGGGQLQEERARGSDSSQVKFAQIVMEGLLQVLVEEEAKLGADIKKSQREIESLIKGLEDVEDLLNEVKTKNCISGFESIEYK